MLDRTGNDVIDFDFDVDVDFLEPDVAETSDRGLRLRPDDDNVAGVSELTDSRSTTQPTVNLPPQSRAEIQLYGRSDDPRDRAAVDYLDF
jgi:hypothetical protein